MTSRHQMVYQSPDITFKEVSAMCFLCSSQPLATSANLDPWIEETSEDDIVLVQDR